jgi:hypothetical protein
VSTDFTQQVPVRVLLRSLEALNYPVGNLAEDELGWKALGGAGCEAEQSMKLMETRELEKKLVERYSECQVEDRVTLEEAKRAAKNDDAQVNAHDWNRRVCEGLNIVYCAAVHGAALDSLRRLLLRRYRSYHAGIIRSFRRFMQQQYGCDWLNAMRAARKKRRGKNKEIVLDYDVGIDAIHRGLAASFWEWDEGSTVFFWRWPVEVRKELRDGLKVWYRDRDLPSYWGRQRWPEDEIQRTQLREKISKVISREYIVPGYVNSLTGFFAVPKGIDDIRVVYDATKSGLNDAIWTPNFFLPTATSVLDNATERTFFGDIDLGEMFLNFFLDSRLRPWTGVDVSALLNLGTCEEKEQEDTKRWILRWERSLMGVRSSPFNCVRVYLLSEDIIKGDHLDETNPFRWDQVKLNLPGTSSYNPCKPWIYKWDSISKKLAAFVISYVDDLRTGDDGGRQQCDHVTHCVASKLNYLGEQDAARKRGAASQQPGPWAGSVIEAVDKEGLYVTISQEKWVKVQDILRHYDEKIKHGRDGEGVWVSYKQLEQDTSFLVHVFMTYENLRPYLKGFYLTLNEWRFDRDAEGWKLGKRHWEDYAAELFGESRLWKEAKVSAKTEDDKLEVKPKVVTMMPQMIQDVEVLGAMFKQEIPSKRLIRGFSVARIMYGFGDASGAGFGTSWEVRSAQGDVTGDAERSPEREDTSAVRYRFGRWGREGDNPSSNYRELRNLVNSLELMGESGELSGVEVFLFTDNSTAEAASARGSSSCKALFELVKRMKLLEMWYRTRLHVIHVSGRRMIAQGADGLSRGCLSEGVMRGEKMEAFVPLHKTAVERSEGLIAWLQSHCDVKGHSSFRLLKTEDWYVLGHDLVGSARNGDGMWLPCYGVGNYIWAPPPCVALQCLEELRKARHKRQVSAHVFICPRIMNAAWQRHLYKSADLVFSIPPGHTFWSKEQHEPLIVGLYFPFLQSEPWQLKGTPKILGMARHLQRVCKTNPVATGRVLRQLWEFTRQLPSLPKLVVLQLLQGTALSKVPSPTSRKRRRTSLEEDT